MSSSILPLHHHHGNQASPMHGQYYYARCRPSRPMLPTVSRAYHNNCRRNFINSLREQVLNRVLQHNQAMSQNRAVRQKQNLSMMQNRLMYYGTQATGKSGSKGGSGWKLLLVFVVVIVVVLIVLNARGGGSGSTSGSGSGPSSGSGSSASGTSPIIKVETPKATPETTAEVVQPEVVPLRDPQIGGPQPGHHGTNKTAPTHHKVTSKLAVEFHFKVLTSAKSNFWNDERVFSDLKLELSYGGNLGAIDPRGAKLKAMCYRSGNELEEVWFDFSERESNKLIFKIDRKKIPNPKLDKSYDLTYPDFFQVDGLEGKDDSHKPLVEAFQKYLEWPSSSGKLPKPTQFMVIKYDHEEGQALQWYKLVTSEFFFDKQKNEQTNIFGMGAVPSTNK